MLKIFNKIRIVPLSQRIIVNIRWFSDEDSSDDEKKKARKENASKQKSDEAIERLNQLLRTMSKPLTTQESNIITAKNKRQEGREKKEKELKVMEEDTKNLQSMTKKIAQKIGGNTQKTESELLSQLLGLTDHKQTNLKDLIGGLKVEKDNDETPKISKAKMIRAALPKSSRPDRQQQLFKKRPLDNTRRDKRSIEGAVVDLFSGTPLNIFERASTVSDICETWSRLEKNDLKLAVTHPPRNYFEKMALWTEQGKIWKFPIDNEQGWDVEHQTDFTEHVMLETHLEGWCPNKGPIRHFMELVCVGLSKNNFLSAKEKYEHIMWYKGYFEEKKDALGELLTVGIEDNSSEVDSQKQVKA